MLVVVDYGMGNIHSVAKALEAAGADVVVSNEAQALRDANRVVLPGQGAFGDCVTELRRTGLVEVLEDEVWRKGKPFLGICLGLQLLADWSEESEGCRGLGWLPGYVRHLSAADEGVRLPHIGWNDVSFTRETPLASGLRAPVFYFDHSYHIVPDDPSVVAASCDYGNRFVAAIQHENLFATQFHPEKSQEAGLRLLRSFLRWNG